MLTDGACPDRVILWWETDEFSSTAEADALSDAVIREQFGTFRDIRVDVIGRFKVRTGHRNPEIQVQRLISFSPIPGTQRMRGPVDPND
jgi:hypothetical protein